MRKNFKDYQIATLRENPGARGLTFDADEGPGIVIDAESGSTLYNMGVIGFFKAGMSVNKFYQDELEGILGPSGAMNLRTWLDVSKYVMTGETPATAELRAQVAKEYRRYVFVYHEMGIAKPAFMP